MVRWMCGIKLKDRFQSKQLREILPINQSCFFRVVQVTKSLQDPLEVGNSLPGISDNVRE